MNNQLEKLVGAWMCEIRGANTKDKVNGAVLAFTSDGIVITERPPHPFETPAMGAWTATGPQTAAYTLMVLGGSEADVVLTKAKIVGTLQYDAAQDSWSGPYHFAITDMSGHIIETDTSTRTLEGTRITVEAMPK